MFEWQEVDQTPFPKREEFLATYCDDDGVWFSDVVRFEPSIGEFITESVDGMKVAPDHFTYWCRIVPPQKKEPKT